jgi:AcrR family transcriptional regulator
MPAYAPSPGPLPGVTELPLVTERILDAALAEFSAFGLRRTSMEDVARRAGVARGTVYRKFAAKDALVQAVILREGRRFMAEFAAVVEPYPAIADKLVEGWVFSLAHMRGHALFCGLLFSDPEAMLPYLTVKNGTLLAVCRAFVAQFIRDAQHRGELEPFDPDPPAELMARIVTSYIVSPDGCLDLADEQQIRAFARRHLVPIITGTT